MKTILSFFAALCISVAASGQTDNIFAFRDVENSVNTNVTALANGESDFLYGVVNDSINDENTLVKMDEAGNIIWQKKLLEVDTNKITYCQIKFHNNYVYILGYYNHPMAMRNVLLKVDNNGTLVWAKSQTCVSTQVYHNPSLEISFDNKIIVSSSTHYIIDMFCLNEDGSTNWTKRFSTTPDFKNPNFDICATSTGNILGCTKAENEMNLYCLGTNGNTKWMKTMFESNTYTRTKSIIEINSNKFLICGLRYPDIEVLTSSGFYAFIDSSGNFTDFRYVHSLREIKNGIILNNGNILLCGLDSLNNSHYLEIQSNGDLVSGYYSSSAYANNLSYNSVVEKNGNLYLGDFNNIKKMNDFSTFACVPYQPITYTTTGEDPTFSTGSSWGPTYPNNPVDNLDLEILESNNLVILSGCSSALEIEDHTKTNIKFYPTLLSNNQSIFIEHEISTPLQYQMMDINGKMISYNNLVSNSVTINALSNGMYVLKLISNENVVGMTKFVVTN